jgi:hypothetical protein
MSGGLFANALLRELGRPVAPELIQQLRQGHADAFRNHGKSVVLGAHRRGARVVGLGASIDPLSVNTVGRCKNIGEQCGESAQSWHVGLPSSSERAGSFAALGRTTEAQATVKKALRQFPNLTVEGVANGPSFCATERERYFEVLPAAGIPLCATSEALAGVTNPVRLPECIAKIISEH